MEDSSKGFLESLALRLATSESALRLLASLFSGYLLAYVYRHYLSIQSVVLQHLFFIICGLSMSYFNFGSNTIYSFVNISIVYVILLLFGGTKLSVAVAFSVNMTFLIVGYYITMTESYTITWTTPHCVLTLRLTGLVFDVYDGRKPKEQLSSDEVQSALCSVPSLLAVFAHSYYFGGFLVGPQFPMKRYLSMVDGELLRDIDSSNCTRAAVARLVSGVCYTLLYQFTSLFLPDTFLLTDSFQNYSMIVKCLLISLWGKCILYKYVGIWLLTDGVCTMTGITYNGRDTDGNALWNGCANIQIRKYEGASTCQEIIQSFNINTNKWMSKYVYKRLRFLGSKELSQAVTLFFLAIWHGLHSGYFMNFLLEYFILNFERQAGHLLGQISVITMLTQNSVGRLLIWSVNKLTSQFALSYALVSFCLFTFPRYWQVYSSIYLIGHVWYMVIWPLSFLLSTKLVKVPKRHNDSANSERKQN